MLGGKASLLQLLMGFTRSRRDAQKSSPLLNALWRLVPLAQDGADRDRFSGFRVLGFRQFIANWFFCACTRVIHRLRVARAGFTSLLFTSLLFTSAVYSLT